MDALRLIAVFAIATDPAASLSPLPIPAPVADANALIQTETSTKPPDAAAAGPLSDLPVGAVESGVSLQTQRNGNVSLRHSSAVHDGDLLVAELQPGRSCSKPPAVQWQGSVFHPYAVKDGWLHVLLPVSVNTKPGVKELTVDCAGTKTVFNIMVTPGTYPESRLTVDPKFTSLPPHRVVPERAAIEAALSKSAPTRLWSQAFVKPTAGGETSPFGVRRTFNGQLKGRHLGEDFDGKIGEALWAANDGVVVLAAQDFFYVGNAVFIDHGEHLYTMYFHMTQLQVKTGDQVVRGQLIGNLGATGRVTGPHVHFGVKLAGTYVNPAQLLSYNPGLPLDDALKLATDH